MKCKCCGRDYDYELFLWNKDTPFCNDCREVMERLRDTGTSMVVCKEFEKSGIDYKRPKGDLIKKALLNAYERMDDEQKLTLVYLFYAMGVLDDMIRRESEAKSETGAG